MDGKAHSRVRNYLDKAIEAGMADVSDVLEPVLCNRRSHRSEKPAYDN